MITGGINAIIANHLELRRWNMTEQLPYEVENAFLNFDTFFGFMILIEISDGFAVLVIGDDPALSHRGLTGITNHVFDNLILS
jgi:hypothetical protein